MCPYLTTADVITGELSHSNVMCLQKAFNSMIRFVYGLRKYDHISHFSNSLMGLPLDEFLRYRRLVFLFNLIKTKKLEYLYNRLNFGSIRLRNFILPSHDYDFAAKSFFISDIDFWNHLPSRIKNSTSVNIFKENLKCYLS